jgi:O-antigen biosynthesis protein
LIDRLCGNPAVASPPSAVGVGEELDLTFDVLRRKADRWWRRARKRHKAGTGNRRAHDAKSRQGRGASPKTPLSYESWTARHGALSEADRTLIRGHIATFTRTPRLSVLLALRPGEPRYLQMALDSVAAQLYYEWELCVVADSSVAPATLSTVEDAARSDSRIKLSYVESDATVAARVNEALAGATGEWVVMLDQHDVLAEHALYLVADAVNADPDAAIVYSDEDEIDGDGRRSRPYFKPD